MKLRVLILVLLMTVFCIDSGLASGSSTSTDEVAAVNVVTNYLQATMVGDVLTIQQYLAPELVKKRQALLNNPSYPQQLSAAYANASYEITDSRALEAEKIQIDTRIRLNNNDTVHSRFVLDKFDDRYLIISEK
jgi:hypothetical protein